MFTSLSELNSSVAPPPEPLRDRLERSVKISVSHKSLRRELSSLKSSTVTERTVVSLASHRLSIATYLS